MKKVTGIKSVDFKIKALGHGVVNWNGSTSLNGGEGITFNNHSMPKLRGYTNLTGKIKEGTGFKYLKEAGDINFKETPLYVSQNCIRHHLFKDQAFDLHFADGKNIQKVLSSIMGLVRGYVVTSIQCKRTSPLLLEDFVDQLGNGNFEQHSRAGDRNSSSIFSKTTFGDTEYLSYGSISIEQLQFISLDSKFDRAAMSNIKEGQGEIIAKEISDFIKSLSPSLNPVTTFHPNYVRKGTIFEEGEMGILLDEVSIKVLIDYTLEQLSNLAIRQAKGYMYVDEITVDYNDSNKMMRIKRDESEISEEPQSPFAVYFYPK